MFRKALSFLSAPLLLAALASPSLQAEPERVEHVTVELIAAETAVLPGEGIILALRIEHDSGWHTYYKNPGESGYPTALDWDLPEGFSAEAIRWPTPHRLPFEGLVNYGYEDTILLPVLVRVPDEIEDDWITFSVTASWLMCKEVCIPGEADLSVRLPVAMEPSNVERSEHYRAFEKVFNEQLPQPLRHWSTTAFVGEHRTLLRLRPEDAEASADPGDLYFFADEESQVIPSAAQREKWYQGDYWLELFRTDYAKDIDRLDGVLTATGAMSARFAEGQGAIIRAEVRSLSEAPPVFEDTAVQEPAGDSPDKASAGADSSPSSEGEPVKEAAAASATEGPARPANGAASGGFATTLGLAFIGGLVLNLMPCVFPVIGLKAMGFVQQAGARRARVVAHGLAYTVGVLLSFWALAGLLLLLRAGGEELGWGFQLQLPAFNFALAAFFLIFALNLSGLFEIGQGLVGTGAKLTAKEGLAGSLFSGVLATVVATPCAAPFLAPALGAALALPATSALLTFTAIALGLAVPYLLLSVFPSLVKLLPRPGAWMETFKQLMAFPLYGAAAFLLYVLMGQVSDEGRLDILLGLVVVALAVWVYGRWTAPVRRRGVRVAATASAALLLAGGLVFGWPEEPVSAGDLQTASGAEADKGPLTGVFARKDDPQALEVVWAEWSPAAVEELRAAGRPVYVDFTASWCATCKVNKRRVFGSETVLRVMAEKNVALLKADWTNRDPRITAALENYGRAAVPFNVVHIPGRADPVILPELLGPQTVLEVLRSL